MTNTVVCPRCGGKGFTGTRADEQEGEHVCVPACDIGLGHYRGPTSYSVEFTPPTGTSGDEVEDLEIVKAGGQTPVEIFENEVKAALAELGIVDKAAYNIIIRLIEPRRKLTDVYYQRGRAAIAQATAEARQNENYRAWGSVIDRNKDEQIAYFRSRAQKLAQPQPDKKEDDDADGK